MLGVNTTCTGTCGSGSGIGKGMVNIRQMHRLIREGRLPATVACSAAGAGTSRPRTFGRRFADAVIPALGARLSASVSCAPEFAARLRRAGNAVPPLASSGRGVPALRRASLLMGHAGASVVKAPRRSKLPGCAAFGVFMAKGRERAAVMVMCGPPPHGEGFPHALSELCAVTWG